MGFQEGERLLGARKGNTGRQIIEFLASQIIEIGLNSAGRETIEINVERPFKISSAAFRSSRERNGEMERGSLPTQVET